MSKTDVVVCQRPHPDKQQGISLVEYCIPRKSLPNKDEPAKKPLRQAANSSKSEVGMLTSGALC